MATSPDDREALMAFLGSLIERLPDAERAAILRAATTGGSRPATDDEAGVSPELLAVMEHLLDDHFRQRTTGPSGSGASTAWPADSATTGKESCPETFVPAGSAETLDAEPVSGPAGAIAEGRYGPGRPWSGPGRYRIERPHAQGGLGRVSVATDLELDRHVALKELLDHRADDPASRAKFVLEAEVTGKLEHPGIVPVYGLGVAADGRPYYAMRFIRGESLAEAVARTRLLAKDDPAGAGLRLRELLLRFVALCDAIGYAHSRGVLHRDLKPANVMLGPFGETLVVDWGLARLFEVAPGVDGKTADDPVRPRPEPPADPEATTAVLDEVLRLSASGSDAYQRTVQGTIVGTPAYMSPEQAEGTTDGLGPATDVYGLGAILYAILTGTHPVDGRDAIDLLGKVRRGEVPPARSVDPTAPRPLEAICRKAMALRPADRYESAGALALDVKRWLADEPVTAEREPWPERLARRARRHRTVVAALAVGLLVAAVGSAAIAVVSRRAEAREAAARDRAQDRFALAGRAIRCFHDTVAGDALLKQPDSEPLRRRLLGSAASFYRELADDLAADPNAVPDDRLALADAYYGLGSLAADVGTRDEAIESYRRAEAVYRELFDTDPARLPERGAGRARDQVGKLLEYLGRSVEAEAAHREAQRLLSAALAAAPGDPAPALALADSLNNLGVLYWNQGDAAKAAPAFKKARDLGDEALDRGAGPDADRTLARVEGNLANVLFQEGDMEAGLAAVVAARDHFRRCVEATPDDPEVRDSLGSAEHNVGLARHYLGDPDGALDAIGAALEVQQSLVDAYPNDTDYRASLARTLMNLGVVQLESGRLDAARDAFDRALPRQRALVADHPDDVGYRGDLGLTLDDLGSIHRDAGRLDEARAAFEEALAIRESIVADTDDQMYRSDLADTLSGLARVELDAGRKDAALDRLRRAIALREPLTIYPEIIACNLAIERASASALVADPAEADALAEAAVGSLRSMVEAGFRPPPAITSRLAEAFAPLADRPGVAQLLERAGAGQ